MTRKRQPRFMIPPPEEGLYTPARARRLASQSRKLWAEMRALVDRLLKIVHSSVPYMEDEQRMRLRTLQIVLRGYSPEHRLWAQRRQQGADRDEENSLFHFMNELHDIVEVRLELLEKEVAVFDKDECGTYGRFKREEYFGPGFCGALATLRIVWDDWGDISGMLDSIDYTREGATANLAAEDRTLAAIEERAAERGKIAGLPNVALSKRASNGRARRRR